jgi:GT2 family glycosyltransferase
VEHAVAEAKPTLCIINYNGARFMPTTLGSAVALADRFAEILLVDNASTDDSVAIAETSYPMVRVHRMPDNRGPGAARNAGLREAATDRILFIDNDVNLSPDCADVLVRALEANPNAAVAAPRVLYAHKPEIIQYDGAGSHFLGVMTLENPDAPAASTDDAVRTTLSVITCAFMVARERLPDPEPFDESFFIYLEDHDFGVRMRALGAEILAVPQAVCFHGEGTAGLSIRAEGKYSSMRVFCLIRNRWQFILKNYSRRSLIVLSPLFLVYELAQLGLVVRKGWLREWGRAVAWMWNHWGEVMAKRRAVQTRRKRPDRDLLSGGSIPFRDELSSSSVERALQRALSAFADVYWRGAAHLI